MASSAPRRREPFSSARPQPGTRLPRGNTLGRASRRSLRTNGRTVDPTTPMPSV